jgi:two-component system nitrate/nitrite response regulator NarL
MTKGSGTVRIVLADDHPIFRDGLRKLLEAEDGFQVIGEAGDGKEAVDIVRRLKPDILLLDLSMPSRSGLEALRDLESLCHVVRTIVLTVAIDRKEIVEALQLGARGIVLKESATQVLLKSVRSVMADQYWVGRGSVASIVQALRELTPSKSEAARTKKFGLTPREMEIIGAIVEGCANKEIAAKCQISEETVKHHLTNIFDKLGVSNRLELALFAANHHLVTRD